MEHVVAALEAIMIGALEQTAARFRAIGVPCDDIGCTQSVCHRAQLVHTALEKLRES